MSNPFDIAKEEYVALQKEIENDLKDLSDLERNTVLAAAIAYSWVTANATLAPPLAYIAWFVPVLLPVYGAARTSVVIRQLWLKGAYLLTVEAKYFPPSTNEPPPGWQHYFARKKGAKITNLIRNVFWTTFLVLSLGASVIGSHHSSERANVPSQGAAAASPSRTTK